MNIQQANLLLEKINALHKSINLDDGEVSSIERDLMMSYVRQLYEAYMDTKTIAAAKPIKRKVAPPIAKPAPKPEPVVEAKIAPPPPRAIPEPTPAPAPKPVVKETPAPIVAPPPAASRTSNSNPAIEALFGHKAATELSEKLSLQNISDLTKALSINDKLLYSNELFGRDMSGMNTILDQLNKLSNMDEAKFLLVGIAEKNNWADGEKSEVAQSFIKLIRRRY